MRASAEEISAMKARLAEKREQKKLERDIAQAIAIVHHRPFAQPVPVPAEPAAERKTGSVIEFILWHTFHRIREDWIFFLVIGMVVWMVSNIL